MQSTPPTSTPCVVMRKPCCNVRSYPCDKPCERECVRRIDMLALCQGARKSGCTVCPPQNRMNIAGPGCDKPNSTSMYEYPIGEPFDCRPSDCSGKCCMNYANPCAYRCMNGGSDIQQVIPNEIGSTMVALRQCPINELWSLCR